MKKLLAIIGVLSLLDSNAFAAGAQGIPYTPLNSGSLVGVVGHSFAGFDVGVNTAVGGTSSSDNYDFGGGYSQAWAQWPNFSADTWYDANSPYTVDNSGTSLKLNGSNAGLASDHLESTNTVPGCYSRWATMLATNVNIVIDDCVLNTINSGDTGGAAYTNTAANTVYIEAELEKHINLVQAAHKIIILAEVTPAAYWPLGDNRFTVLANVNTWINAQVGRPGVYVWPRYSATAQADGTPNPIYFNCDASTTLSAAITTTSQASISVANGNAANFPTTGSFPIYLGLPNSGGEQMLVTAGAGTNIWTVTRATESSTAQTFASGALVCGGFIHPNFAGAYKLGQNLVTVLQGIMNAGSVFNQDATASGNLVANGGMTGTTGTCNAAGMSGTLATNYTATFATQRGGSTAVCSQTTIDGTHTKNTLTITPGNAVSNYDATWIQAADIISGLPAAGQCVQQFLHVTFGATPPARIRSLMTFMMNNTSLQVQNAYGMNDFSSTYIYPSVANWSGWVHTNPTKVPAGQATTLSAAITTTGQTSITVASATGFPTSNTYNVMIDSEIVTVTAGQGTTTWTVSRGQAGTTAATHSNGATATMVLSRVRNYLQVYGNNTGSAYSVSVDNWINKVVPCPWTVWGISAATP